MAERDVGGLPRGDGDGHAAAAGGGAAQGVGLGVEGDHPGLERPGDPAIEGLQVLDADVAAGVDRRRGLGLDGGGDGQRGRARLRHPPGQGAELHRLQEGGEGLPVRIADAQVGQAQGRRRVVGQPHQFAGEPHLVGEFDQGLAPLRLFDLVGALEQGVEVAELGQELGGGLDPDARGAGHVVHRVSGQRLDLHDLFGPETELLDHLLAADLHLLDRVEQADLLVDQLHQVLVRGYDHHLAAGLGDLAGVGGDDVVGLVALHLDGRHAEGAGGLAHQRELRDEVRRRRRAVGLVLVVELGAEGLLGGVEHHRQVGRLVRLHVADQLPQHVAEAGHRAHGQAVGLPGQGRQGVEGAEDVAGPVHQVEPHGLGRVHPHGPPDGGLGLGFRGVEHLDVAHGRKIGAPDARVTQRGRRSAPKPRGRPRVRVRIKR